ncbi:hypothetical protein CJF32_00009585 [Rutstroemia sp. NJR-2017a WRK4]|nr:hypothetical protein CJF32_00009585 [Rutstroemia sp. NJR-2017a WRK4]
MTKARKLALIGVFLLGTLVVVAGILRLVYLILNFYALKHDDNLDTTCKSLRPIRVMDDDRGKCWGRCGMSTNIGAYKHNNGCSSPIASFLPGHPFPWGGIWH